MAELAERFLQAFIPLFIAIDPIGLAAIFLFLGRGMPAPARSRIARHAIITAAAVALLFLFLGRSIFTALGISVSDFQIAGGLILFVLAARELLLASPMVPTRIPDDFGVVPLGMPLIAGPASITTLLLLTQTVGWPMTLLALAANLGLVMLAFDRSEVFGRMIGTSGLHALSKIIAMLLAAIAVNMIRRGIAG